MEVRKLDNHDLDEIYAVAEKTLSPLWSKKEYGHFLTQPSSFCWGIDDSQGVVCFTLALLSGRELDIVSIATRRDAQGKRLASQLLEHLLKNAPIEKAFLEVDPTNEPAVRLYLRTGFIVLGRRKKYYGGKKDAWVMKWER